MRIGERIILVMLVICVIVVRQGVYSLLNLEKMNRQVDVIFTKSLLSSQSLFQADLAYQQTTLFPYRHITTTDKNEMDTFYDDTQNGFNNTAKYLGQFKATGITFQEDADLAELYSYLGAYTNSTNNALRESSLNTPDAKALALGIIRQESQAMGNGTTGLFDQLLQMQVAKARTAEANAQASYDSARVTWFLKHAKTCANRRKHVSLPLTKWGGSVTGFSC